MLTARIDRFLTVPTMFETRILFRFIVEDALPMLRRRGVAGPINGWPNLASVSHGKYLIPV